MADPTWRSVGGAGSGPEEGVCGGRPSEADCGGGGLVVTGVGGEALVESGPLVDRPFLALVSEILASGTRRDFCPGSYLEPGQKVLAQQSRRQTFAAGDLLSRF